MRRDPRYHRVLIRTETSKNPNTEPKKKKKKKRSLKYNQSQIWQVERGRIFFFFFSNHVKTKHMPSMSKGEEMDLFTFADIMRPSLYVLLFVYISTYLFQNCAVVYVLHLFHCSVHCQGIFMEGRHDDAPKMPLRAFPMTDQGCVFVNRGQWKYSNLPCVASSFPPTFVWPARQELHKVFGCCDCKFCSCHCVLFL